MLNFFLCFRSELATEVVLHGIIRLDSKIRSQNVHFHDSLWREQTLAATKYCFAINTHHFAALVSSRAVRISSRAVTDSSPVVFIQEMYGTEKGSARAHGKGENEGGRRRLLPFSLPIILCSSTSRAAVWNIKTTGDESGTGHVIRINISLRREL